MDLVTLLAGTRARVVFMDCDGVIYDTNRLKCDAFRHALEGYPRAAVDELVAYHRATGGVSRYVKIDWFFRELHPVPDPESASARALLRFAEFCERGYGRMQPRADALAFAAAAGGSERVYVVSASDEEELRGVFDAADIRHRFAEVHGSPVGKKAHVSRILTARSVAPEDALFIGDGWGDWDAATALGVPFVFLSEMSEWEAGHATIAGAASEDSSARPGRAGALVAEAARWDILNEAFNGVLRRPG